MFKDILYGGDIIGSMFKSHVARIPIASFCFPWSELSSKHLVAFAARLAGCINEHAFVEVFFSPAAHINAFCTFCVQFRVHEGDKQF